jgi:hypothetical protein
MDRILLTRHELVDQLQQFADSIASFAADRDEIESFLLDAEVETGGWISCP